MLMFGIFKYIWKDMLDELRLAGKIIFSPLLALITVCAIPVAIIEVIVVDSWIILSECFRKDSDVIGVIEYMINF